MSGVAVKLRRRRAPFQGDLLTRAAALLLLFFLAIAILGPVLPIGNPDETGVGPRLGSPSGEFIAGTDSLGRSLLPRLAQGLRTTLLVAGTAVLVSAAVSIVLGMVAAYFRGFAGEFVSRGADVLFAFPAILLAILIAAISGPGITAAVISISLIVCPLMLRVVRAASLSVVDRDFVVAARVGGAGSLRILAVHVLPNIAGTAVVQATYALSVGMLVESALSFLGLGVQAPEASLGSLVYEGAVYLPIAPWLVLIPGILLALVIVSVNLLGDGLRDALDVRRVEVRG
jgi:peptide/nickel transport system permease protein